MKALQNPVFLQREMRREQNCFSEEESKGEFAIYAGIMRKYEGMFFSLYVGKVSSSGAFPFFCQGIEGEFTQWTISGLLN